MAENNINNLWKNNTKMERYTYRIIYEYDVVDKAYRILKYWVGISV